jgi:hypothetical protein
MAFHPKTLVCSVATRVKEGEQLKVFSFIRLCHQRFGEEMYEMGNRLTPIHHIISNWHEINKISDIDYAFTEESVGKVLIHSQSFLFEIDSDNSREVEAVCAEVCRVMAECKRLMKEKDTSYKMSLPEILDLYSKSHYVQFRAENWSASNWCCTCVSCLHDCICAHSTLMDMVFHATMAVPDSIEDSLLTVSKLAGPKRCIAGTKRNEYPAAKALESKKSFVKSKILRAVGPLVLSKSSCCHVYTLTHYPLYRTPPDTGKNKAVGSAPLSSPAASSSSPAAASSLPAAALSAPIPVRAPPSRLITIRLSLTTMGPNQGLPRRP